jgi:hypothetical protein
VARLTGTPIASERLSREEALALLSVTSAALIAFDLRVATESSYGGGQEEDRTDDQ